MKRIVFIRERGVKWYAIFISICFLLFFAYFQSSSIYGGDAGDLVTAAFVGGVPHPPGYPLYTFLAWVLTHLPYSTVAWRVTLLSSIPSSVTLGIFFLIIHRFTKNTLMSILSTVTIGFSYLFWLYASVPEVFALHSFFVLLILYLLIRFSDTKMSNWFFAACFFFGLSLTHHHFILFMVPAYAYLVYPYLKNKYLLLKGLMFISIGLIPYIYVVIAALSLPVINWENPSGFNGFFRLVTRALYGTFRSGPGLGLHPYERYASLRVAFETFDIDFTRAGILLACFGAWYQFKAQRRFFITLLLAFLMTGPLFIYYSSFPISLNFTLATSERFLLVPYLFLFMWVGLGMYMISKKAHIVLLKYIPRLPPVTGFVFLLVPMTFIITNWYKITPLKNDQTVEHFVEDIFKTTPDNAILFLTQDTPLFNTQYVYYTQGKSQQFRSIKIVHAGVMTMPFYMEILKKEYPELDFSINLDNKRTFMSQFADKYLDTYPILTDTVMPVDTDYGWLPTGLLFRLYKLDENKMNAHVYDKETYSAIVQPLFDSYNDPLSGALGIYTHLMLSDVLRFYGNAYQEAGREFLTAQDYEKSEMYLQKSILFSPNVIENKLYLAQALIGGKKCQEADSLLNDYSQENLQDVKAYQLLALLHRSCWKDEVKAQEYEVLYKERLKEVQTQLENF